MLPEGKYLYRPAISPMRQFSVIIFILQLTLTHSSKLFLVLCWIVIVCLFCFGFDLLFTECSACAQYCQEQKVKTSQLAVFYSCRKVPRKKSALKCWSWKDGSWFGWAREQGREQSKQNVSLPGPQRSPGVCFVGKDSKVNTRDWCRLTLLKYPEESHLKERGAIFSYSSR